MLICEYRIKMKKKIAVIIETGRRTVAYYIMKIRV